MSKKLLANVGNAVVDNYRRYYQEYEGTFITATDKSEDDTIDTSRFIEVTEIWGNTVQDENNLEDIQSVGELYVDDEGNPILDDLGREQYKIEIESCNAQNYNLSNFDVITNNNYILKDDLIALIDKNVNGYSNFIFTHKGRLKNNTKYTMFVEVIENTLVLNHENENQNKVTFAPYNSNSLSTMNFKAEEIPQKFVINFSSTYDSFTNELRQGQISVSYWLSGNLTLKVLIVEGAFNTFEEFESNKTTILLPCQLQKVGNVYDRLYWDSEKGKYVVEKNVGVDSLNRLGISIIATHSSEHARTFFRVPVDIKKGTRQSIVKGILNKDDRTKDMFAVQYDTETMLFIRKSLIKPLDPENITDDDIKSYVQKLLSENEYTLYYQRETPELIETNITEKILLPCYEEKTHIFVNSTVDATMKVLVPYKEIL